jgi:hypothetical protein
VTQKKPRAVRRVAGQRVTITLTETPQGTVRCNVTFKPDVDTNLPIPPAVHAAVTMLEALAELVGEIK